MKLLIAVVAVLAVSCGKEEKRDSHNIDYGDFTACPECLPPMPMPIPSEPEPEQKDDCDNENIKIIIDNVNTNSNTNTNTNTNINTNNCDDTAQNDDTRIECPECPTCEESPRPTPPTTYPTPDPRQRWPKGPKKGPCQK